MTSALRSRALSTSLALLLATRCMYGQSSPPVCSVGNPKSVSITHTEAHPSPEQLTQTLASATADPTILTAAEPANFGIARYRIADYASCTGSAGCYWADIDAQTRRAENELDRLIASHRTTRHGDHKAAEMRERLAIVLDIDETSLSSYCEEIREDYGFIPEMFNTWVVSSEAAVPIPGTLRLFRHARAAGVAIFFLTGRPHEQAEATSRNLHAAGYDGWTALMTRSEAERHTATTEYKAAARARLVAEGYTLLLNVGDQWSDLLGDPRAELSVKLPNPFYYLP